MKSDRECVGSTGATSHDIQSAEIIFENLEYGERNLWKMNKSLVHDKKDNSVLLADHVGNL